MVNTPLLHRTKHRTCLLLFFLSTLGGAGGAGGGGGDRPADIKDVLDLENLRLSDHTNKASKTQVTVYKIISLILFKNLDRRLNSGFIRNMQNRHRSFFLIIW